MCNQSGPCNPTSGSRSADAATCTKQFSSMLGANKGDGVTSPPPPPRGRLATSPIPGNMCVWGGGGGRHLAPLLSPCPIHYAVRSFSILLAERSDWVTSICAFACLWPRHHFQKTCGEVRGGGGGLIMFEILQQICNGWFVLDSGFGGCSDVQTPGTSAEPMLQTSGWLCRCSAAPGEGLAAACASCPLKPGLVSCWAAGELRGTFPLLA